MKKIITKDYFQSEVREGFEIQEKMKRVWAVYLDMLMELSEICKEQGIIWYVAYGTLLGAVRHGGFIPWDDDVDIWVKRSDFKKLMLILENEMPDGFRVGSRHQNKFIHSMDGYLQNADSISYSSERLKRFYGCPYVVTIDIYPLDVFPEEEKERKMHKFLFNVVYDAAQRYSEYKNDGSLPGYIEEIEKSTGYHFTDGDTEGQLWFLADNIASMYNDISSDNIAYMPDTITNKNGGNLKKEWFSTTTDFKFESITVPVPIGYKEILRAIYGEEYMIPKKGCASHEYPFYAKQDILFAQKANGDSN